MSFGVSWYALAQVATDSGDSHGSERAESTQRLKENRHKGYTNGSARGIMESPFPQLADLKSIARSRCSSLDSETLESRMSKAAGRPRSQLGRKISAGRDWQFGMR